MPFAIEYIPSTIATMLYVEVQQFDYASNN